MFGSRFNAGVRGRAQALAVGVVRLGVTPNQVTVAGAAITLVAALLAAAGWLLAAGLVLTAAGLFDVLDGAVARAGGQATTFGAFLDSTLDRLMEASVLGGVAVYFAGAGHSRAGVAATVGALAGSFLVSYAKARAQALGVDVRSGFFARPERVVLTVAGLVLAAIFGAGVLLAAMVAMSVLTLLTAGQRVMEVLRATRPPATAAPPGPAAAAERPYRGRLRRAPERR